MNKFNRISILVVIVLLATLWFFPMWQINLKAPQYPGGLVMTIWINDVKGDVEIINGLNHYIGMMTIEKEDFKEFVYLPIAVSAFMILGALLFIWYRRSGYYIWTALFVSLGLLSFYDFYSWLYKYGNNLDPNAPIQVPGMSYQPPLIGYKKLLNFEVLSQPHVGGWCFIISGILMVWVCYREWKKSKSHEKTKA